MLVLATTTERTVLQQLDIFSRFDADIAVPTINTQNELAAVLRQSGAFSDDDINRTIGEIQQNTGATSIGVGIKKILTGIETASNDPDLAGRMASVVSAQINAYK